MDIHTGVYTDAAFIALMNAADTLKEYEKSRNKTFYSKLIHIKRTDTCDVLIYVNDSSRTYQSDRKRKIREYDYYEKEYYTYILDKNGNKKEVLRKRRVKSKDYRVRDTVVCVDLYNPFAKERYRTNPVRVLKRYLTVLVKHGKLDSILARGILGVTPASRTNKKFIEYVGEPFNGSSDSYYNKFLKENASKIESDKYKEIQYLKSSLLETISNTAKPTVVRSHINLIDLVPGTIIKVPTLSGTTEEFKILDVKISNKLFINLDRGILELDNSTSSLGQFRYDYGVSEGDTFKLIDLNRSYNGVYTIKLTPQVVSGSEEVAIAS